MPDAILIEGHQSVELHAHVIVAHIRVFRPGKQQFAPAPGHSVHRRLFTRFGHIGPRSGQSQFKLGLPGSAVLPDIEFRKTPTGQSRGHLPGQGHGIVIPAHQRVGRAPGKEKARAKQHAHQTKSQYQFEGGLADAAVQSG